MRMACIACCEMPRAMRAFKVASLLQNAAQHTPRLGGQTVSGDELQYAMHYSKTATSVSLF